MRCAWVLFAVAGCGYGFAEGESGGADDLPTAGAGPFRRLPETPSSPAEEPWLATQLSLELSEAELVPRAGGGFHFWLTREPAALPSGDTEIWSGALRDPHQRPDQPAAVALAATLAWEAGRVAAPAIVVLPDRWVMFYEAGDPPAIGRAESRDGGSTWTKSPAPVLSGAASPAAAFDGETWIVGFVRVGQPGIWTARSTDGEQLVTDPEPILLPRYGTDEFDAVEVRSPSIRWLIESSGRGHWALWYAGLEIEPDEGDAPRYAIGYAASFDGLTWERLMGGRPVFAAPAGAPAVIVDGPEATLLFETDNRLRASIGVGVHP